MVRFAVIPDIHLGRDRLRIYLWDTWDSLLFQKETSIGEALEKRLEKSIEQINKERVDFTVIIGDITESATFEQFSIAKKIFDDLKSPIIPMVGNHDLKTFWRGEDGRISGQTENLLSVKEIEDYFNNWKEYFEVESQGSILQNYGFVHNGIRFIILDNVNRNPAIFGLPGISFLPKLHKESKEWLTQQIRMGKEKRIVIFSHAPLKIRLLKSLKGTSELNHICGHFHRWNTKRAKDITVKKVGALYIEPKILLVEIDETRTCFVEKKLE